jgi:hypothetical protein
VTPGGNAAITSGDYERSARGLMAQMDTGVETVMAEVGLHFDIVGVDVVGAKSSPKASSCKPSRVGRWAISRQEAEADLSGVTEQDGSAAIMVLWQGSQSLERAQSDLSSGRYYSPPNGTNLSYARDVLCRTCMWIRLKVASTFATPTSPLLPRRTRSIGSWLLPRLTMLLVPVHGSNISAIKVLPSR